MTNLASLATSSSRHLGGSIGSKFWTRILRFALLTALHESCRTTWKTPTTRALKRHAPTSHSRDFPVACAKQLPGQWPQGRAGKPERKPMVAPLAEVGLHLYDSIV